MGSQKEKRVLSLATLLKTSKLQQRFRWQQQKKVTVNCHLEQSGLAAAGQTPASNISRKVF
jgi:hypothetical protein